MTSDQQAIIVRIRRKAEIIHLDLKARGDTKHHDAREIMLLIDLLERNLND